MIGARAGVRAELVMVMVAVLGLVVALGVRAVAAAEGLAAPSPKLVILKAR